MQLRDQALQALGIGLESELVLCIAFLHLRRQCGARLRWSRPALVRDELHHVIGGVYVILHAPVAFCVQPMTCSYSYVSACRAVALIPCTCLTALFAGAGPGLEPYTHAYGILVGSLTGYYTIICIGYYMYSLCQQYRYMYCTCTAYSPNVRPMFKTQSHKVVLEFFYCSGLGQYAYKE